MIATSMAMESRADLAGMPKVAGVEHRLVDANGLRMHVAEAGEGDPLVMLHGWPQHWYEWRHLIGPLAERHRVICPDLRGLGWTDAPPRGYEKENLATDVLALLDALEVERFRLVGHDWGGWVGFLIGFREPERIERFLALNIMPPFTEISGRALIGTWRFWYQWVLASPGLGPAAVRGLASGNAVLRWVGGISWSEEDRNALLGPLRQPARANASVQYYRTFQLREIPELLRGRYRRQHFQPPTLLLFGTGDHVMKAEWLEGAERRADDFSVELVPGVGHFIADEAPNLVRDRALSFFGDS
ncbi:MAG TPA: alpha/beta hydrolase [Solirubrobacterales bacterium]|nr:alpha/beta hydrolase [Solirubrobacterales bacterium]